MIQQSIHRREELIEHFPYCKVISCLTLAPQLACSFFHFPIRLSLRLLFCRISDILLTSNCSGIAIASILHNLESYAFVGKNKDEVKLVTPIHIRIGEKAFGTSPGFGELMYTIRATYSEDFTNLKTYVLNTIKNNAEMSKLQLDFEWVEEFPNTSNNSGCVEMVTQSAKELQLNVVELTYPFRWSEDFGHFLAKYPGALFGLGAGNDHPAVHNPDYDFPDELIGTGINLFFNIYKSLLF